MLGALLSSEAESSGGLHFGHEGGMWGTGSEDGDSSEGSDVEENYALEHVENEAVLKAAGLQASKSTEDILRASWQDVMDRSTCTTPVPGDPASDTQDPLSGVSIRAIIRQGLDALAAADSGCLAAAAEQLGPGRELQALQELMKQ